MFEEVIDKLKEQHQTIHLLLNDVLAGGLASEDCKNKLEEAHELFVSHVDLESEILYPTVDRASEIAQVAALFNEEISYIKAKFKQFVENVDQADDKEAYLDDMKDLIYVIQIRMMTAEKHLYEAFLQAEQQDDFQSAA